MSSQTMRVSLTPNRLHAIGVSPNEDEAKKARPRPGTLNIAVLRSGNATDGSRMPSPMSAAAPREVMEESASKMGRSTLGLPATTRRSRISNPPSSYRGPDGAPTALPSSPMKAHEEAPASSRSSDGRPISSEQHHSPRAALKTIYSVNDSLAVVGSEGSHAPSHPDQSSTSLDRARSLPRGGSSAMEETDKKAESSPTGERLTPRARSHSMTRRSPGLEIPAKTGASYQGSPGQVSATEPRGSQDQPRVAASSVAARTPPRLTVSEEPAPYEQAQGIVEGRSTPVGDSRELSGRGSHLPQATRSNNLGKTPYLSSGFSEAARHALEQDTDRDSGRVTSPPPCSPSEENAPRSSSSTQSRFTSGQLDDSRTEGPPSRKIPYGRRISRDGTLWGPYRRQSADSAYKALNGGDGPVVEADLTRAVVEKSQNHLSTSTSEASASSSPTIVAILTELEHRMKSCATVEACQSLVGEALAVALRGQETAKQATGQTNGAGIPASSHGMTQQLVSAVNAPHTAATISRNAPLHASIPASHPVLVMSTSYQEDEDIDSATYKETQFVAAWLLDDGAPADAGVKSTEAVSVPAPRVPHLRSQPATITKVYNPSPVVSTFSARALRRKVSTGTMGDAAYLTADEEEEEEGEEEESDSLANDPADGSSSRGDHVRDERSPSAFFGNREGVSAAHARDGSNSSASTVSRPPPSASRAAIRAARLSSDGR